VHNQKGRDLNASTHGWKRAEAAARTLTLEYQGLVTCLAVEMAVNEENEQRALHGELAMLEEAWKEAEEVGAIADQLSLPGSVDDQLTELKGRGSVS
jgi:hypothetical protein